MIKHILLFSFALISLFVQGQSQVNFRRNSLAESSPKNISQHSGNFSFEEGDESSERSRSGLNQTDSLFRNDWQAFQNHRNNLISLTHQLQGNWVPLGPSYFDSTYQSQPGAGKIVAIGVAKTDSTIIYAGSPSGGLWK